MKRMTRFTLSLALALAVPTANAQNGAFKVVVNSSISVSTLTLSETSQYFLKKKTRWPAGETVVPVDQAQDARVRAAFSKTVLNKDVAAVKGYWRAQIFSGRGAPPAEKPSDAAVLAFVAATPGAIGYVASGTAIGAGVKEVKAN